MSQTFRKSGASAPNATPKTSQPAQVVRQRRIAALSLADEIMLETEAAKLPDSFSYIFLRRPEPGLVMLEGRAGNTGQRFNLGEMLITRCVVRLESQESNIVSEGYGFAQGNRPRHAELAAMFDALLQQKNWEESLERSLIGPLIAGRKEQLRKRAEETADTKVDFFTMVRGEDK